MGTFFSTRHTCLQSKWPTMMEITDVLQRRMFPQSLFCPVDCGMVLRVQGQSTSCLWYVCYPEIELKCFTKRKNVDFITPKVSLPSLRTRNVMFMLYNTTLITITKLCQVMQFQIDFSKITTTNRTIVPTNCSLRFWISCDQTPL